MPIRRELRDLYPAHWRELSRRVRFERAHGMCQGCGRPHGATVRCLPDGRWYDSRQQTWRDRRGRSARWPDLEQIARLRTTRVGSPAYLEIDKLPDGRYRATVGTLFEFQELCRTGDLEGLLRHTRAVESSRSFDEMVNAIRAMYVLDDSGH